MKRAIPLLVVLVVLMSLVFGVFGCATPTPSPTPTPTPSPTPTQAPVEAEYEIAFASIPLDDCIVHCEELFVELVNARSEGRIKVTYFGHHLLGTGPEQMEKVKIGEIEMAHTTAGTLVTYIPWGGISADLPFVWDNTFDCFQWHERVFTPVYNEALAPFNMMMMPYWGSEGCSGIWSAAGPIHSPADLEGKIFRSRMPGVEVAVIEAMGATAAVIPAVELYTSMEQGLCDVMHNPAMYGFDMGYHEICDDFAVTDHKVWVDGVVVCLEWWNSLPKDVQDLLNGAWYDAAAVMKWMEFDITEDYIKRMVEAGVNVYYPTPDEMAQFKDRMTVVYDWARDEYGADKVDMLLDYAMPKE